MTGTGQQCLAVYAAFVGAASLAALNAALEQDGCPAIPAGVAPPPTPASLAAQAAASFRLPSPTGNRSPLTSLTYMGDPFTYVNLWTYFWTSPGSWKSLTATAAAGGNSATVTAKPVLLTFDPGDGSDAVSCDGPGNPWVTADGNDEPSDGCGFQYRDVSGPGYDHPFTSTQTITWQLTWTGTGNTTGVLNERTTSTTGVLNVLQIQAVDVNRQ